jgi:hypothetical protein
MVDLPTGTLAALVSARTMCCGESLLQVLTVAQDEAGGDDLAGALHGAVEAARVLMSCWTAVKIAYFAVDTTPIESTFFRAVDRTRESIKTSIEKVIKAADKSVEYKMKLLSATRRSVEMTQTQIVGSTVVENLRLHIERQRIQLNELKMNLRTQEALQKLTLAANAVTVRETDAKTQPASTAKHLLGNHVADHLSSAGVEPELVLKMQQQNAHLEASLKASQSTLCATRRMLACRDLSGMPTLAPFQPAHRVQHKAFTTELIRKQAQVDALVHRLTQIRASPVLTDMTNRRASAAKRAQQHWECARISQDVRVLQQDMLRLQDLRQQQ